MGGEAFTTIMSAVLCEPVEAFGLVDRLQQIRSYTMARLLHLRIAAISHPATRQACLDMVDALSEMEAARLLRSPALCELLRRGDDQDAIISILNTAHGADGTVPLDAWSALGDCWLGAHPPPGYPGLADRQQRYWSPMLACGVPLDLSLGAWIDTPSAGLLQAELLSEDALAGIVPRLDEAIGLLATVYPPGHDVFSGLVANVLVRSDTARASECWGASSGIAAGRVVVVNIDKQPDTRLLGEVLLHEATHCALDYAEFTHPLWRPEQPAALVGDSMVASPWTSNPLTPHAFLHASVVWAVLLHYWQRCEQHLGADAISHARRAFIARGFRQIKLSNLETAMQCLSPSAFGTLTAARAVAQAA